MLRGVVIISLVAFVAIDGLPNHDSDNARYDSSFQANGRKHQQSRAYDEEHISSLDVDGGRMVQTQAGSQWARNSEADSAFDVNQSVKEEFSNDGGVLRHSKSVSESHDESQSSQDSSRQTSYYAATSNVGDGHQGPINHGYRPYSPGIPQPVPPIVRPLPIRQPSLTHLPNHVHHDTNLRNANEYYQDNHGHGHYGHPSDRNGNYGHNGWYVTPNGWFRRYIPQSGIHPHRHFGYQPGYQGIPNDHYNKFHKIGNPALDARNPDKTKVKYVPNGHQGSPGHTKPSLDEVLNALGYNPNKDKHDAPNKINHGMAPDINNKENDGTKVNFVNGSDETNTAKDVPVGGQGNIPEIKTPEHPTGGLDHVLSAIDYARTPKKPSNYEAETIQYVPAIVPTEYLNRPVNYDAIGIEVPESGILIPEESEEYVPTYPVRYIPVAENIPEYVIPNQRVRYYENPVSYVGSPVVLPEETGYTNERFAPDNGFVKPYTGQFHPEPTFVPEVSYSPIDDDSSKANNPVVNEDGKPVNGDDIIIDRRFITKESTETSQETNKRSKQSSTTIIRKNVGVRPLEDDDDGDSDDVIVKTPVPVNKPSEGTINNDKEPITPTPNNKIKKPPVPRKIPIQKNIYPPRDGIHKKTDAVPFVIGKITDEPETPADKTVVRSEHDVINQNSDVPYVVERKVNDGAKPIHIEPTYVPEVPYSPAEDNSPEKKSPTVVKKTGQKNADVIIPLEDDDDDIPVKKPSEGTNNNDKEPITPTPNDKIKKLPVARRIPIYPPRNVIHKKVDTAPFVIGKITDEPDQPGADKTVVRSEHDVINQNSDVPYVVERKPVNNDAKPKTTDGTNKPIHIEPTYVPEVSYSPIEDKSPEKKSVNNDAKPKTTDDTNKLTGTEKSTPAKNTNVDDQGTPENKEAYTVRTPSGVILHVHEIPTDENAAPKPKEIIYGNKDNIVKKKPITKPNIYTPKKDKIVHGYKPDHEIKDATTAKAEKANPATAKPLPQIGKPIPRMPKGPDGYIVKTRQPKKLVDDVTPIEDINQRLKPKEPVTPTAPIKKEDGTPNKTVKKPTPNNDSDSDSQDSNEDDDYYKIIKSFRTINTEEEESSSSHNSRTETRVQRILRHKSHKPGDKDDLNDDDDAVEGRPVNHEQTTKKPHKKFPFKVVGESIDDSEDSDSEEEYLDNDKKSPATEKPDKKQPVKPVNENNKNNPKPSDKSTDKNAITTEKSAGSTTTKRPDVTKEPSVKKIDENPIKGINTPNEEKIKDATPKPDTKEIKDDKKPNIIGRKPIKDTKPKTGKDVNDKEFVSRTTVTEESEDSALNSKKHKSITETEEIIKRGQKKPVKKPNKTAPDSTNNDDEEKSDSATDKTPNVNNKPVTEKPGNEKKPDQGNNDTYKKPKNKTPIDDKKPDTKNPQDEKLINEPDPSKTEKPATTTDDKAPKNEPGKENKPNKSGTTEKPTTKDNNTDKKPNANPDTDKTSTTENNKKPDSPMKKPETVDTKNKTPDTTKPKEKGGKTPKPIIKGDIPIKKMPVRPDIIRPSVTPIDDDESGSVECESWEDWEDEDINMENEEVTNDKTKKPVIKKNGDEDAPESKNSSPKPITEKSVGKNDGPDTKNNENKNAAPDSKNASPKPNSSTTTEKSVEKNDDLNKNKKAPTTESNKRPDTTETPKDKQPGKPNNEKPDTGKSDKDKKPSSDDSENPEVDNNNASNKPKTATETNIPTATATTPATVTTEKTKNTEKPKTGTDCDYFGNVDCEDYDDDNENSQPKVNATKSPEYDADDEIIEDDDDDVDSNENDDVTEDSDETVSDEDVSTEDADQGDGKKPNVEEKLNSENKPDDKSSTTTIKPDSVTTEKNKKPSESSENKDKPAESKKPVDDKKTPSNNNGNPTASTEKPTGNNKISEDKTKPSENTKQPQDKPADTGKKPTKDNEKPKNDKNPSDKNTKPADSTEKPTGDKKPAKDAKKPSESDGKPRDNDKNPTDGTEKTTGNKKPTKNDKKPSQNNDKPNENIKKPNENSDEPADSTEKPENQKPADDSKTPSEDNQKPKENIKKPNENSDKPSVSNEKPENQKPVNNNKKPSEDNQKPNENIKKPNENSDKPADSNEKPGNQKPVDNTKKPSQNNDKPNENTKKPNGNSNKPSVSNEKPENQKPIDNSKKPLEDNKKPNQNTDSTVKPNVDNTKEPSAAIPDDESKEDKASQEDIDSDEIDDESSEEDDTETKKPGKDEKTDSENVETTTEKKPDNGEKTDKPKPKTNDCDYFGDVDCEDYNDDDIENVTDKQDGTTKPKEAKKKPEPNNKDKDANKPTIKPNEPQPKNNDNDANKPVNHQPDSKKPSDNQNPDTSNEGKDKSDINEKPSATPDNKPTTQKPKSIFVNCQHFGSVDCEGHTDDDKHNPDNAKDKKPDNNTGTEKPKADKKPDIEVDEKKPEDEKPGIFNPGFYNKDNVDTKKDTNDKTAGVKKPDENKEQDSKKPTTDTGKNNDKKPEALDKDAKGTDKPDAKPNTDTDKSPKSKSNDDNKNGSTEKPDQPEGTEKKPGNENADKKPDTKTPEKDGNKDNKPNTEDGGKDKPENKEKKPVEQNPNGDETTNKNNKPKSNENDKKPNNQNTGKIPNDDKKPVPNTTPIDEKPTETNTDKKPNLENADKKSDTENTDKKPKDNKTDNTKPTAKDETPDSKTTGKDKKPDNENPKKDNGDNNKNATETPKNSNEKTDTGKPGSKPTKTDKSPVTKNPDSKTTDKDANTKPTTNNDKPITKPTTPDQPKDTKTPDNDKNKKPNDNKTKDEEKPSTDGKKPIIDNKDETDTTKPGKDKVLDKNNQSQEKEVIIKRKVVNSMDEVLKYKDREGFTFKACDETETSEESSSTNKNKEVKLTKFIRTKKHLHKRPKTDDERPAKDKRPTKIPIYRRNNGNTDKIQQIWLTEGDKIILRRSVEDIEEKELGCFEKLFESDGTVPLDDEIESDADADDDDDGREVSVDREDTVDRAPLEDIADDDDSDGIVPLEEDLSSNDDEEGDGSKPNSEGNEGKSSDSGSRKASRTTPVKQSIAQRKLMVSKQS